MNLFPREQPFVYNGGGYSTLSFIPTLATMVLGLLTGNVLKEVRNNGSRLLWLVTVAVAGIALGMILDATGVCPLVKRIWTPSWTLYSGGVCCLMLAFFHILTDVWHCRLPLIGLTVLGVNSIAAYLIHSLTSGFLKDDVQRHFPVGFFQSCGESWEPILIGTCVFLIQFSILVWMYRRKIFLRI